MVAPFFCFPKNGEFLCQKTARNLRVDSPEGNSQQGSVYETNPNNPPFKGRNPYKLPLVAIAFDPKIGNLFITTDNKRTGSLIAMGGFATRGIWDFRNSLKGESPLDGG